MAKPPSKKSRKLLSRLDKAPLAKRIALAGGSDAYFALRKSVRPLDFMPAKPKKVRP